MPKSGFIDENNMVLATDFYQLTMGAAYYQYNLENGIKEDEDIAVFELFIRKYPRNRNYLIFAGLEQVTHYLQNARFTKETIEFLRKKEVFRNINPKFFDEYLKNFKFKLDVWSMREGTFFFPNEPVMIIQGPIFHAQLVETYILNVINYQTIVASKASRIKNVAPNKVLLDFGTRRSHSPLAGVYAARASHISGFDGTSNVIADLELGINSSGTMAHSFVQKFEKEIESFDVYYNIYEKDSILLIDTYDTEKAAGSITKYKNSIKAVRIDSGDLLEHSKNVRKILDDNGCDKIMIVASSDLNEYKIKKLLDHGAPINAFGIGTELATSRDDPSLSAVYKLMEYNGQSKIKISENKMTLPGIKQVYRVFNESGKFKEDIITLHDETPPFNSEGLLIPIMKGGKLLEKLSNLESIRQNYFENMKKLPNVYKGLEENHIFKLKISKNLQELTDSLRRSFS